ncbi:hypothetical protein Hanom_Chr01g00006681 [Helianthus anomalus]
MYNTHTTICNSRCQLQLPLPTATPAAKGAPLPPATPVAKGAPPPQLCNTTSTFPFDTTLQRRQLTPPFR